MLERRFRVPLVVVVRSHSQLRKVVGDAPAGFGKTPDTYHSDTIFLRAPLTAKQAMRIVELARRRRSGMAGPRGASTSRG